MHFLQKFQLTASRRGWQLYLIEKHISLIFQLTASRRGWHHAHSNFLYISSFQLTASRRGWRILPGIFFITRVISTHSLTKRLTGSGKFQSFICSISTHSLTKRLTLEDDGKPKQEIISTHSLTKRLTNGQWECIFICCISTHSLTKRLTTWFTPVADNPLFQLTASRRGWPIRAISFSIFNYFNSQPHEEADQIIFRCLYVYIISTHSLTKRLTVSARIFVSVSENFNSQPHEDADGNFAQKFLVQNCIFVTITYIAFSVHLLFNFLRIFSSWIYPFAGANAPEKVVCLTFALIISRYL